MQAIFNFCFYISWAETWCSSKDPSMFIKGSKSGLETPRYVNRDLMVWFPDDFGKSCYIGGSNLVFKLNIESVIVRAVSWGEHLHNVGDILALQLTINKLKHGSFHCLVITSNIFMHSELPGHVLPAMDRLQGYYVSGPIESL